MSFKSTIFAAAAAIVTLGGTAFAEGGIMVNDAYARSSTAMSQSGAAFMVLMNTGTEDDRLIAARSPIAERVELHTHIEEANGVMKMVHVEEGFAVPAGSSHALDRGGDHVMFLGLTAPMAQGDQVPLTLVFEKAGEVELEVPVDLQRQPDALQKMKDMHKAH